jgi:2-dehydropantoate 2-reductase
LKTPASDLATTHWHVLGAGAMGCLWAVRLWQHPPLARRVTLLLRSAEELETYRRHGGVRLEEGWENPQRAGDTVGAGAILTPVPAAAITDAGPALSHLLVATKSQDVAAALHSVRARLTPGTCIVLLQNGVRVQREITDQYGADRVYCLSTSHGAWRRGPFHVVHAGRGTAWLGQLESNNVWALDALLARLPAAAMQIDTDPHIARRLWQKFAVNCAVNALTVLYDCRNGELLKIPQARRDLDALTGEIERLLDLLPEVPPLPDLRESVAEVLRVAAENVSSTLQDARQGRATELAHLNGYLCELATLHGLDSPLNIGLLQRVASRSGLPGA